MSLIAICPACSARLRVSEQITDKTLICPRCLADVHNPWPGSLIRAGDINTDVKRDVKVGSIVLAVLIGLCVLGIATALFAPVEKSGGTRIGILFYSCAALAVLVSIAIIRASISFARDSVVGGCGIAFLVLGAMMAIFIFFFFACASLWSPALH